MSNQILRKIAVIGCGAMGRQIAMNTALNGRAAGYEVVNCDSFPAAVESAAAWASDYLKSRVEKGRISEEDKVLVSGRLAFSENVDEAVKDADFVVEAIIEDLKVKRELFERISRIVKPDTVLSTNSSNIVSSKLADVTVRPERLLNVHYFNPALVMKAVELVKGPHTSEETIETAREFCNNTGKTPIIIRKEIAGFVANRINAAVAHEALFLLENGVASIEDIDAACEKALNYPMGPFRLMDLTGIDVYYHVRVDRFAESHDPYDAPHPLAVEKYKKGEYGRKTGKGWYDYTDPQK